MLAERLAAIVHSVPLPVTSISPNPRQPRVNFDQDALEELANSIRQQRVLQPILVCHAPEPGKYIVLAGERRLRASLLAGIETIPARVITATDVEQLEFAIIENVQREDLNPVEEAQAYQQLIAAFGYSQDDVANRVGKSRVAVANSLRLLKRPAKCLQDLSTGALSAGHARAILMLHHPLQQEQLRQEILDKALTVRQAEDRARAIQNAEGTEIPEEKVKKTSENAKENLDVLALQEKLILGLGCKARIKARTASSGSIEIFYQNLDDLDRVLSQLGISMDEG